MKRITLEPEFPPPRMSTDEKIYRVIKKHGPLVYKDIGLQTGLKTGGNMSNSLSTLAFKKLIIKRKCECGMHNIYEVIK